MRVLWVENHAAFVRVAGRQFLAGHDLTVVPSLALAREALAVGGFDVVLLDYDLDDGKGENLIPFIRQLVRTPAVVAVSAHEEGNRLLRAAGADAACPKHKFPEIAAVLARLAAACGEGEGRTGPGGETRAI